MTASRPASLSPLVICSRLPPLHTYQGVASVFGSDCAAGVSRLPNMGSPHGPVLVGARQNIAFSARDAAALGARITVGRVGLMHGLASGFWLPALWQNRTFSSRPRATASRPRVP